jgi:hypothetical protein
LNQGDGSNGDDKIDGKPGLTSPNDSIASSAALIGFSLVELLRAEVKVLS